MATAKAETLPRLLQALGAAETAYAKAMTAISHVPLAAERDGDTLRAALNAFSDLPQAVAQTHSALQIGMSAVTRSLHEVVTELRWEWEHADQTSIMQRASGQGCCHHVSSTSAACQQQTLCMLPLAGVVKAANYQKMGTCQASLAWGASHLLC